MRKCSWVNIFHSHKPAKKMHVQLIRLWILLFTLQGFSHLCREKRVSRWKAMLKGSRDPVHQWIFTGQLGEYSDSVGLHKPFTQLLFLLYYITALPLTALNLPLGIKNVCVYCTDVRLLSKYNSMAMGLETRTQLQQQQSVALNKPLTLPKSWLGLPEPIVFSSWV